MHFSPDTPNTVPFWDDDHISAQMLAAHLDPTHDAASRRPELRQATLDWLERKVISPGAPPLDIVDLGCGPGLYATALAQKGHRVTGIDFSRRSIAYARERAAEQPWNIRYRRESYLTLEDEGQFDLALMIWCDLGALTRVERDDVLRRIHRALKPGGTLVFDVWGPGFPATVPARKSWSWHDSGFWSPGPHLVREEVVHHPGVVARRIIVWETEATGPKVFFLRDYWFDRPELLALVARAGFVDAQVADGVLGPPETEEGMVRFVSARKSPLGRGTDPAGPRGLEGAGDPQVEVLKDGPPGLGAGGPIVPGPV